MDYVNLYTDFLKGYAKIGRPLSVVCDSSNGATGAILRKLLPGLGLASFALMNDDPDPDFPAHGPNPLLPGVLDSLSKAVVEKKADLGVAFDADGDRAFFVDEKGAVVPSFAIVALMAKDIKPPYVADELVFQALRSLRLFSDSELYPSRVGVYFIKEKMREVGGNLGGEFSGHFYFNDFFGSDSGIFSLVTVLNALSKEGRSLSEFAASLPRHAVANDDLNIAGKDWTVIQQRILDAYSTDTIERRDGISIVRPESWVSIRPSNTEPILRFYAGAPTLDEAKSLIGEIKAFV